jgi:glycerol uptake facilitator protein
MGKENSLGRECAAEVVGTFFLVFFGTGAVFVAALTGSLNGLFQVGIVWGLAIALAIYAISAISGAHLNPAVTIAVACLRGFPARKIIPYIIAQLIGAILASLILYVMFSGVLKGFEKEKGIVRGQPGSERSAMVFGEYFPNPGAFEVDPHDQAKVLEVQGRVSELQAMLAEAVGTALLIFFIFAMTDARNRNRPDGTLFAVLIGLTITILICVIAPLTQACFNPARDFGPRLFSYFAGWGRIAIPGPRGGFFTVYILSPIIGGVVGGLIYDWVIRPPEVVPPTAAGRAAVDGKGLVTETTAS